MITLDQVLLLQEKVENAVEKIVSLEAKVQELNLENDALRSRCAELSKALSEKTELVSNLEITQSKIESVISLQKML
jgi:predicted RNase H-like nuclease (RuvC/YqgF family)